MRCGNDPRIVLEPADLAAIEEFRRYLKGENKMTTRNRTGDDVQPTKTDVVEFDPKASVTESPTGWEWDTIAEGAALRVEFDTIGDQFIGQYIGEQHVEREPSADGKDQSFDLFNFRGRDGELYAINQSYALIEAMTKVTGGQWCRITYIKDVKTSRGLNDMKDFRVDVRK